MINSARRNMDLGDTTGRASSTAFAKEAACVSHTLGHPTSHSERAAVSSFGASLALEGNELACQAMDLHGEPWAQLDYEFHDLGGNECGCPEPDNVCNMVTTQLEPPGPL